MQEENEEGWFAVDIHRAHGDLFRKLGQGDKAETEYRRGLSSARESGDLLNQLRCSMGLVELAQNSTRAEQLLSDLEILRNRITQGNESPDLLRAAELLGSR